MVVSNQHENKKGDQFQGFGVECQPFIKSEEDIMGRRRVPGMAGTPTGWAMLTPPIWHRVVSNKLGYLHKKPAINLKLLTKKKITKKYDMFILKLLNEN